MEPYTWGASLELFFFISTRSKDEYTRLWGTCFFFNYFPIQGYPMWTHAQILLKDFDHIRTKVIFRSIYFNRELPVITSEACFFFFNFRS